MITIQDAIKSMKEYQAQDSVSDEEMVGILYAMFQEDKLTVNELGAMLDGLGYELSEEFLNMNPEDQKTKLYEEDEDEAAEGVSNEEVEDAKEYGDNGQKTNDGDNNKEENPFKKDNKPQNENDEEREQARKLYGFDK